jgi:hypothetical protein
MRAAPFFMVRRRDRHSHRRADVLGADRGDEACRFELRQHPLRKAYHDERIPA